MIERDIDRLLLVCVKARYDGEALDEAKRIVRDGQVNWERFLHEALVHSVAPLVYDTLRDNSSILPARVKEELRTTYYQTAAQNALRFQELAGIVQAFNEAGIPVIVLKGAALAQGVYRNIALRPMGDIDLLVAKDKMSRAEQLFVQEGYAAIDHSDPCLRHATFACTRSGWKSHIEVHRHIVSSAYYRRTIPEGWLWQDPVHLSMHRTPAVMLSPERAIVHSCLHLLDHVGTAGTLLWLCDIREISQRFGIDWEVLADVLVEFKMVLPVGSMLFACSRLLELPIPDHVRQRLLAHRPGFLERKAYQFCLSPVRSSASKTFFDFLAVEGISPRARYLRSRLFPDRDYMIARYSIRNPRLVPLYYPRMILEAALDAFRAPRR